MSDERAEELGEVHARAREAAEALEAQASKMLELTKQIEGLTGGTTDSYAGMRTKVEARETLRQIRVLARTMDKLDERLREVIDLASEDLFHDR